MDKTSQIAFAKEAMKKQGVASDLIDLEAEMDSTLTYKENYAKIQPMIYALTADTAKKAETQETKGTADGKFQKHQNEAYLEYVDEQQKQAIQQILTDKESRKLHEAFEPLIELTKATANGTTKAVVIEGTGAVGKTYNVIKTLNEMGLKDGTDYAYFNTYTTPLELYRTLYDNKDKKAVIFDDVAGLFSNDQNIALLKSAMWGMEGKRILQYLSTTNKLGHVPERFILEAGVIILTNKIPHNPHVQAILSRAHYLTLDFTHNQKIQLLYDVAKNKEYKSLTKEQRIEVMNWLKESTTQAHDINFRTLIKCYDLYIHDSQNWTGIAKHLFKPDETMQAYINATTGLGCVKEQVKEFTEKTGLSRATFFRIKEKIRR